MYKYKKMDIKDYKEIIELWKNDQCIVLHYRDDSKKSINNFIKKNPNTCFTVEFKKEIIGTIMGGNDGRRGLIYHLFVKLEHRKNGIGKKLLEKAEKGYKKEGIGKIYLLALKKNKIGNEFWENNKYVFDGDVNFRSKRIIESQVQYISAIKLNR
jgi:ribosomal protein S18 acetylase RimI-like enzyme